LLYWWNVTMTPSTHYFCFTFSLMHMDAIFWWTFQYIPREFPCLAHIVKKTNVIIMLKIIWHFSPQNKRCGLISVASLCLPAANLQIYMQGSCSIKSSKPDHKQGYFMSRSLPIFRVQEINSVDDELTTGPY